MVAGAVSVIHAANMFDAMPEQRIHKAKRLVEAINDAFDHIGKKLHQLESEGLYIDLGFESMEQLIESDYFTKGRSTLYRKLRLAKLELRLTGQVGEMVQSHVDALNKFPPEYQQLIWDYANNRAQIMDKKLSASIITVAGKQIVSMGATGTVNGENMLDDAFNEAMREWRLQRMGRNYILNGRAVIDENGYITVPRQELPPEAQGKDVYYAMYMVEKGTEPDF